MQRVAWKLKLRPGALDEYRRRHDAIWPEMAALIRAAGISDFRIWHDPETNDLFCSQLREGDDAAEAVRSDPVWQRWQAEMAAFLVTGSDGTARRFPLTQVFHLK